jgi:hypothetical protein
VRSWSACHYGTDFGAAACNSTAPINSKATYQDHIMRKQLIAPKLIQTILLHRKTTGKNENEQHDAPEF